MAKKHPPAPPARGRRAPTAPPAGHREVDALATAVGGKREPPAKAAAAKPTKDEGEKLTKFWQGQFTAANKQYEAWANDYEVRRLDQYYRGKQWKGLTEVEAAKKYVVNMIFATVETQLPSLLFSRPRITVEPRPAVEMTADSNASGRATLIQQTLQTQVDNPDLHFGFITTLALHGAYARFAVVEVGYSDDWIDNPNAGKPVIDPDTEKPMIDDETQAPLRQPAKTKKAESLYVKRIPANCFRAYPGRNMLTENDWCGYWEWQRLDDVRNNPAYKGRTAGLASTGTTAPAGEGDRDSFEKQDEDAELRDKDRKMVKIWKVWDLRGKKRLVLAEGHKQVLLETAFTTLPLADMKFFELDDSYYPIPPIYNWIGPQDEINETREMMKTHRRRALRRYMYEGNIDVEELGKMETGEDMVAIKVPKVEPAPIKPIENASLDQLDTVGALASAKDDLTQVTGVSGEAKGIPQADTATQANIINVRAQVRESRARTQVADWLGAICRLMLLTIREKMSLPLMVKKSVDPFSFAPRQVEQDAKSWTQIRKEELGDLNVDIKIDVSSLSPVAAEAERQGFDTMLMLIGNQQLAMFLMTPSDEAPTEPPPLLRKWLALHGIKSDQEVREIFRVGQKVMERMALVAMAQAASAGKPPVTGMPGGPSPELTAPQPPGGPGAGPRTGLPAAAPGAG